MKCLQVFVAVIAAASARTTYVHQGAMPYYAPVQTSGMVPASTGQIAYKQLPIMYVPAPQPMAEPVKMTYEVESPEQTEDVEGRSRKCSAGDYECRLRQRQNERGHHHHRDHHRDGFDIAESALKSISTIIFDFGNIPAFETLIEEDLDILDDVDKLQTDRVSQAVHVVSRVVGKIGDRIQPHHHRSLYSAVPTTYAAAPVPEKPLTQVIDEFKGAVKDTLPEVLDGAAYVTKIALEDDYDELTDEEKKQAMANL